MDDKIGSIEVGQPLVDHKDVSKIAFTGSDTSGQKIYESAAKKIIASEVKTNPSITEIKKKDPR